MDGSLIDTQESFEKPGNAIRGEHEEKIDANEEDDTSDSEDDLYSMNLWTKTRKSAKKHTKNSNQTVAVSAESASGDALARQSEFTQKYANLKERADEIKARCERKHRIVEERKCRRLMKKALRDPHVKEMVEEYRNPGKSKEPVEKVHEDKWHDIKPFLTINDHMQGPVSHRNCGPKTELECIIDDAIKDGDFEKAELLSDTLANRDFAVKISHAFAAKRRHEEIGKEKERAKVKLAKKIPWTFGVKERWQMKGSM